MKVQIHITTTQTHTLPDPGAGCRWARVITHPEFTKNKGLPIQNILDFTKVQQGVPSIPDVFQRIIAPKEKNPVTLTKPIQLWMWRIFKECAPVGLTEDELLRAWDNVWMSSKAFTNGTGPDKVDEVTDLPLYADYVRGTGLWNDGFRLFGTMCRGNLVKVTDEAFWGGELRVQIKAMNALDSTITTKTYKGNEHLFFFAVSWNRMWLNGKPGTHDPRFPYGRGNPFPHFGDDRSTGVPVPILVYGDNHTYLPREWIQYLKQGDPFPNPYWDGF